MDRPIYYTPLNGLPQESKLATYMKYSPTPVNLTHTLQRLNMESSVSSIKKEFVPVNFYMPPNIVEEVRESSPPTNMVLPTNSQIHQKYSSTPVNLTHTLQRLNMESSVSPIKKEFVPVNFYMPANIVEEVRESSPPANLVLPTNSQIHQENVGGTTYFYPAESYDLPPPSMDPGLGAAVQAAAVASPYTSHMYVTGLSHLSGSNAMIDGSSEKTSDGLSTSFYSPDTIRSEIYQKNQDVFLQPDPRQYPELPLNVDKYAELLPLEATMPHAMASSYRATHRQSGDHFALRRLHGHAPISTSKRLDLWKHIEHPNIVRLHEYFTTKAFGDLSTVLVYDYHSGSQTLMTKYLSGDVGTAAGERNGAFHDPFSDPDVPRPYTHQKNAMLRAVACGALLPEPLLWSLLVQLTAALRAIHTAGLACRSLEPTKVLVNGCRVRIAWCGVADSLHPNTNDTAQAQQEDLVSLGRLALALACRSAHCDNFVACMDLVARTYSADFKNLILYLLPTPTACRTILDLMPIIGARFYTQVEALERRADAVENLLAAEMDSGRLLRILIKLGVVNERPELNMDPTWSETGDRYMLKLFRDYLFHSVTEDGRPWLDQSHLTYTLNQLDGGSNDKISLTSRDNQSTLVVSYAELKHCLEQAFREVMQIAATADV